MGELALYFLCGITCAAYCIDIIRYKILLSRRKKYEIEGDDS